MNFRTSLSKKIEISKGALKNVFFVKSVKGISRKIFMYIGEFSETFRLSWCRHIINCLLPGLARALLGFTSPWSFHTALIISGCMKDLGLVNPGTTLAPS